MKAVVKWTLRQYRWSIALWSLAVFMLIFINMIFYPTFKDQAAELQRSFENIPDTTLQFIGGSADFFSPVGFMNSQIFFLMLPLLLGVLAINLGGTLLAKEEQSNTIESLLARPISRSRLLAARAVAGTAILSIVTLVGLITIVVTARAVDVDVDSVRLIVATVACFMLVLVFGSVAFTLTASGKARSAAVGVAAAVALGGYIIGSLAGSVEWLDLPSRFLPFYYYQPEALLRGTYEWMNLAVLVAVLIVAGVLAWVGFRNRDLG